MTALELHPAVLGGSALARAAMAGDPSATRFFAACPQSREEWRAECARVAARFTGGQWLDALAPALAMEGAASERLRRVADRGGVLVTTGQQPGLFGGPGYTWIKAISALALADEIEAATGLPTAALFWAATDDTDFAEGASTWVAGPNGATELTLQLPRGAEGRMLADVPLDVGIDRLVRQLAAASGSTVEAEVLAAVAASYSAGATVGGAYVRLLRALLGPLGVPVLDAAHPAVRRAMDSTMRDALRHGAEIDRGLERCSAVLETAGFAAQVARVDGLSLVFEDSAEGKARVPLVTAGDRVAEAPFGTLGPNVLLRPIAERAILPTIAYVGGPGEIAYFAQTTAVAEAMAVPAPVVLPRWSVTIVEPHVRRLLDRLGHDPDDFVDPHAPERRAAHHAVPAPVRAELDRVRGALADATARLEAATQEARGGASGAPPVPPDTVIAGFVRQVEQRMERLERRYAAAAGRASGETMRDLAILRGALAPGGVRQERALNLIPVFARHGAAVLRRLYEGARPHARRSLGFDAAADAGVPAVGASATGVGPR